MRTLLLICFTLIFSYSFAQPRVVTFGEDGTENGESAEKNAIKINVFEFLVGDFSMYYERALHEKISIEVGVGMTFTDLYGLIAYTDIYSPFDLLIQPKMGFSYKLAARFYPIETFEGFYISPEYKYRKYNWDRQIVTGGSLFDGKVPEERHYSIPRISLGYAVHYNNNLYFDWTVGIGINTATEVRYNELLENTETKKRNSRPRFHVGLKVGYVF